MSEEVALADANLREIERLRDLLAAREALADRQRKELEDLRSVRYMAERAVARLDAFCAAQTPTTTNPFALVPIEDERAAVICEQAAARLRRQSIGTAAAERVARAAIDAEREARETA